MSSLTASYAQTGDSLTCYTNSEMKRIATRVVYANECDSLLSISAVELSYKDSVITNMSMALQLKDSALVECDERSVLYKELVSTHEDTIARGERKLKWTRIGWVATSAALVGLWVSALF